MKIRDLLDKLDAINEGGGGQFYAKSPHDMGSTKAPKELEETEEDDEESLEEEDEKDK